jgi:hypothetical protein
MPVCALPLVPGALAQRRVSARAGAPATTPPSAAPDSQQRPASDAAGRACSTRGQPGSMAPPSVTPST